MKSSSQHPYEHHAFVMERVPNLKHQVVVDVGCGKGVWGFLIRTSREVGYLVGIDINLQYLIDAKEHKIYDDLILASAAKLPLKEKSIDVILAVEIIEHLSETDGYSLLAEIDRVTLNLAVLTTPNGFLPSLTPSDISEIHRSGWKPDQLKMNGYQIFGMGLKIYSKYPSKLTYTVQSISAPFVRSIPRLAAFILALKKYKSKRNPALATRCAKINDRV